MLNNFHGVRNHLKEIQTQLSHCLDNPEINNYLLQIIFNFHFIPAGPPHMGDSLGGGREIREISYEKNIW